MRFLRFCLTVVCALALAIGLLAASASATTTKSVSFQHTVQKSDDIAPKAAASDAHNTDFEEQCNQDGNVSTCTSGSASTDTDSRTKIKRLKINGRVVGEYLVEGGLTRKQVKQSRCYTSHDGWNTLRTSDGKIAKYRDKRAQKICRTGNGPSGWQVVKCGNFYWPAKKRPKRFITVKNPVLVQSFNDYELKGVVKGKAVTTAKAFSASTATCTGSSSTASASGKASGAARFRLSFKFRGKRNVQAEGERVVEEYALRLNVKAYGEARSESSADAATAASCTDTPNPEPEPDKPTVSVDAGACVAPSEATGIVTVVVGNPNDIDDTATVTVGDKPSQTVSIAAGSTKSLTFSGFAPGTYGVSVKLVTANKAATTSVTVEQCDVPEEPTTGDVVCKNPPHLYEGGNALMVCELSQSNGAKPTLSQFSVEALNDFAYFAQPTEFGWREEAQVNACPSDVLCVRVQVWGVSPGLFKYVAKFAEYDEVTGQFLVEEDDF